MTKHLKLPKLQIQYIFTFVQSKYVKYTDVQLELVDHLATGIEELLEKSPDLDFEKALQKVYKRDFPITGFTDFVDSKRKSIGKYYFKLAKREYWNGLKKPHNILIVLTMFLIAKYFIIYDKHTLFILMFVGALFPVALSFYSNYFFHKWKKYYSTLARELFIYVMIGPGSILNLFFLLPHEFDEVFMIFPPSLYSLVLGFFVYSGVIYIESHFVLKKEIEEKYSHLNLD